MAADARTEAHLGHARGVGVVDEMDGPAQDALERRVGIEVHPAGVHVGGRARDAVDDHGGKPTPTGISGPILTSARIRLMSRAIDASMAAGAAGSGVGTRRPRRSARPCRGPRPRP